MIQLPRRYEAMLDLLQRESFKYFLREFNPLNGLVADKTKDKWPASIAAVGASNLSGCCRTRIHVPRRCDHANTHDPAAFNPTFPSKNAPADWISEWHFGVNEGPIVLMIENFRSGFLWLLMRRSPYLVQGLRRAGFSGGWL